jgi:uncharacterized protein YggT (Ycf19 family)
MTDQRISTRTTTRRDPVARSTPIVRTYSDPVDPAPAIATAETVERATTTRDDRPSAATTASRVVVFVFGLLQVALILRIVLLLLVANTSNDVVALILGATDPFVEPFRGMFALDRVTADQGSTLDIAAIVALIGWSLIEAIILAGLRIFERRSVVTA